MDTTTHVTSALTVWPIITDDLRRRLLSALKEDRRPPNSWIIYRMETARGWKSETQDTQSSLGTKSTIISHHWNNILSEETRQDWGRLADWLKVIHKGCFPDYKFAPVSKDRKAEIKRERKLESESNKAMGPAPVAASSRPQPYTKPSVSRRLHRASHSSYSSSALDNIPTTSMAPFQEVGPNDPPLASFPFTGQNHFANNMNDYGPHGLKMPLDESYNYPALMGESMNGTIPIPCREPRYGYMPSALLDMVTSHNALFNITPASYQDVGNWANVNDMTFNGQVDTTIDPNPNFIPDLTAYDMWGNPLDVNQGIMPAPPHTIASQPGPLFLQQYSGLADQSLTRQPDLLDITANWPVWE